MQKARWRFYLIFSTILFNLGVAARMIRIIQRTNSPCSRLKKPPISNYREQAIIVHVPVQGVDCLRFSCSAVLGGTIETEKLGAVAPFLFFIHHEKTITIIIHAQHMYAAALCHGLDRLQWCYVVV